ncbi:MAG: nucleotidyl transferase AbiEii/AbiGii toxin family protein [Candidatus Thorarchaeota archaeon]|nr:nucleotidyl transferase AbiEii/AbiGii toxin family protein [Candidatus Thorarchaeota archaeon]
MRDGPSNDPSLQDFAPEVARDFQVILRGLKSFMHSPLVRRHLALTGGIALHVFHSEGNPSRLTQEIDFNFRTVDIEDESQSLEETRNQIDNIVKNTLVELGVDPDDIYVDPLYPLSRIGGHIPVGIKGQTLDLKFEIGYIRRIPLLKDTEVTLENKFGIDSICVRVPQLEEVISSKIGALLDRAFPRDLFDIHYALQLLHDPLLLRKCFIIESLMVLERPIWELDFEDIISGIGYDTALVNVLPIASATREEFTRMKDAVVRKIEKMVKSLNGEEKEGIESFFSNGKVDMALLDAENVLAPSVSKHPLLRRRVQLMEAEQEKHRL